MPSATFALMLMYDPILNSRYRAFAKYRHLEGSPLAQAMDRDGYLDSRWVPDNARAFVARAKVSRGVLEIWPTHPGWIEHLRVGMKWDTAAYSNGPGARVKARVPVVEQFERSADPSAGFRVGAPKMDDYPLTRALIALHGPNRYMAEPVIKDVAAMRAAVQALMGQPVLLVPKRGPNEVGTVVEVRDDGVYLYSESTWGWGGSFAPFDGLKSLGRAWLKVAAAKPAGATKTTTKKAATKKTAVKKTAVKKTTKKAATKKTATKKTATKKTAKVGVKKAAKKAAKVGVKKAAKVGVKKAAKKTAKVRVKKAAKRSAGK